MEPKIIVLILSYNGKHLLQDSISSYLANDYPNFEVVVIDNGSVDGTKEWVKENYPEVTLLRTDVNLKYSGGFNFGLKYAFGEKNADYVLITNNDVKVDNKVVRSLLATAAKDPSIGFVTGKVFYFDKPDTLQTIGYYEDPVRLIGGHLGAKEEDHGQFDEEMELPFSDDIFILVSQAVYKAVGGYDTLFAFQGEQLDWQIRAKEVGFRIFYSPKAIIWHKESMTIGRSSPFKIYYDTRNTLIVILLHKEASYFKTYFYWHLKYIVLKPALKFLVKFQFEYTYKILKGFISSMAWGIRNRKFTTKHFI